jgi:hypothetical protein
MKLLDLEVLVGARLSELSYPAYLCAMCVIGMQLHEVYAELLSKQSAALVEQSIEVVKSAYLGADDVASEAARIAQLWWEVLDDPKAIDPVGLTSAFVTFQLLLRELAGETRPRESLEYVTSAAADLPDPRFPEPSGPHLVLTLHSPPVDEGSPGVKLLRKFEEVASLAARQDGTGVTCDPVQLHALIFG